MSAQQSDVTVDRANPQNRRYVGVKETAAYVVYDMSQSFNIDSKKKDYNEKYLLLDLTMLSAANAINGIWDIVNDLFIGAIVDRTRTRWGKFKPYLMFLALPGAVLAALYWLLPLFYGGIDASPFQKIIAYLVLQILSEGVGTFQGIARAGIQATITPFPTDRRRLIAIANLVSGVLGEKLPGQITNFLDTLMSNGKLGGPGNLTKLFMTMGILTTVIGSIGAFWFFYVCKERINQSEDKPSIRDSIRTILHNKPILLITLSEMIAGLDVGFGKGAYCQDVLRFASGPDVVGIPAVLVNPVSYGLVPWFRRHFSDRFLFIMSINCISVTNIPVFMFGLIGGKKNGMYKRRVPMLIAMTLHETLFTFMYGVRSVVPAEMRNESMDYCEWKNGYRGEGMISVAKGLAGKLTGKISEVLGPLIKVWIHYDQSAYKEGREQALNTKYAIFILYALVPAIFTLLSSIPMLFYKLDGEERDRMYAELQARRAAKSAFVTEGGTDPE